MLVKIARILFSFFAISRESSEAGQRLDFKCQACHRISQPSPLFLVPYLFPRRCFEEPNNGLIRYANIAPSSHEKTNARFLSAPSILLPPLALEKKLKEILILAKFVVSQFWNCSSVCWICNFMECMGRCIPCATSDLFCRAEIESKICFSNKLSVEPASEDGQLWVSYVFVRVCLLPSCMQELLVFIEPC